MRRKTTCKIRYTANSSAETKRKRGKLGEVTHIQAFKANAVEKDRGRVWIIGTGAVLLVLLAVLIPGKETVVFQMEQESPAQIHSPAEPQQVQMLCREEQYTAVLPNKTIRCSDPDLPEGTETVLREGNNGEILCTALVTYADGVERERKILSQKVRIQPTDRIVAVGIGPRVRQKQELIIGDGIIRLPTGEVLTYSKVMTSLATAYCTKGLTATGTQARVGAIAVDPEVIPYGTRMFIVSKDGEYVYGIATAEDCGSKDHIYDTRIDLHFDTYEECINFGARYCRVYFLS